MNSNENANDLLRGSPLEKMSLLGYPCPKALCRGTFRGNSEMGFYCSHCQLKIESFVDWKRQAELLNRLDY